MSPNGLIYLGGDDHEYEPTIAKVQNTFGMPHVEIANKDARDASAAGGAGPHDDLCAQDQRDAEQDGLGSHDDHLDEPCLQTSADHWGEKPDLTEKAKKSFSRIKDTCKPLAD